MSDREYSGYDAVPTPAQAQIVGLGGGMLNPTLRQNIEAKIQFYKDEIVRLEKVKVKMEFMLDVNLRDLREAMHI